VNSLATLKDMKEVQDNEYSHHMGDATGPRNWDMFARLQYPEEDYYWCNVICKLGIHIKLLFTPTMICHCNFHIIHFEENEAKSF